MAVDERPKPVGVCTRCGAITYYGTRRGWRDRQRNRRSGRAPREVVVECTPGDRERRREQCELIGVHLARTDMSIRIGKGDSYVQVEFPSRPKVQ